ncbi:MAG: hypothetical protein KKE37_00370 [Verrucomicrobia bacterium]|nr:hypothetical protein [Verrucomicrobiota bacterium]MBU4246973.1 hypothetical protein [Verrucomicrobiota bacterium]MBU4290509.1 hypothetical protein [Verrucomicrobiota bacterium]MBU4427790.1 hypothetical protein [Verrucomicrobiota bacterium]MCG2681290.1 hypothetical protein [Kiritimatiellia bacterium]
MMKFKSKINSELILSLTALAGLGIAGCRTTPVIHPEKPIEIVLFVQADKPRWQKSGIMIKRGQIVHCIAEGKWSDRNGTYGPEGNPELLKDHLGLSAPANALLMKIDYHTNTYLLAQVVCVGKEINVTALGKGRLLFANNASLPLGQRGEIKVTVTVAPDADEDGLSDYDEITIWKTNPLNSDSDGDGFFDNQEAAEQKARLKEKSVPPPPP